jgi:hypothetical protein
MESDRVVLCMRWGALYPAVYVNVLHSAVQRNLSGPLRFVCLTNETEGLAPGIEAHPIPDLGFSERHWRHGAWPKLSVFLPDLYGLSGRALFIDLDSVIVGALDPLFEGGGFRAIGGGPQWRRGGRPVDPPLLTGVFAFDLGALGHITEAFRADPGGAFDAFRLEQRFVERHVGAWEPWPPEWVISFKRHLRRPVPLDRMLPPRLPPADARIVAFHGDPRPIEVVRADTGRWGRFPRYGRGPIDWVRRYWLENGYDEAAADGRLRE